MNFLSNIDKLIKESDSFQKTTNFIKHTSNESDTHSEQKTLKAWYDRIELYPDYLIVNGWAISDIGIDRVEIHLDDVCIGEADYGYSREDVREIYPNVKNSNYSGFFFSQYVNNLRINKKNHVLKIRTFNYDNECFEVKEKIHVKEYDNDNLQQIHKNISLSEFNKSLVLQPEQLKSVNNFFDMVNTANSHSSKLVLMIDHNLEGGTAISRREKILKLIELNGAILFLAYDYPEGCFKLKYLSLNQDLNSYNFEFTFFHPGIISKLFEYFEINELEISNLISFRNVPEIIDLFVETIEKHNCSLSVEIYDYFPVCSIYVLMNLTGNYCGVPDDTEYCKKCILLNNIMLGYKKYDIEAWRSLWGQFLIRSDKIIVHSNSSKEIIHKAYPFLDEELFEIVQHKVKDVKPVKVVKTNTKYFNIGILGNIRYVKGSSIVKSMVETIERKQVSNVRIVVIGDFEYNLTSPCTAPA